MLSFIKGFGTTFQEASFQEVHGGLDNPGRGWYRIYTYRLGEEEAEEPVRYEDESLALVLMNVGAYKDQDFDQEILTKMDQILESFERLGFELILRICYDTEGKGMVREPSLFSQIKRHLSQLGPILRKHADAICVFQGLMIGNWGEMHGSRYLLPKCLKELTELFLKETEGSIALALRKPVQYRLIYEQAQGQKRIGFFNDGMLGSETHLGTFAPETDGRGAWQEPWGRQEEIAFMKPFLREVPYGGEVLTPPAGMTTEAMLEVLRELKVSYLNSTHDANLLTRWKQERHGAQSVYDYVAEHLGYRFLVMGARVKGAKTLEVNLKVQNVGFANLHEDAEIEICVRKGENAGHELRLGTLEGNLKDLGGGEERSFQGSFQVKELWEDGTWELSVYAKIYRRRDKRVIRFAQEYVKDGLLLGSLKKGGHLV